MSTRVVARTGDAGAYAEQVCVAAEEALAVPDGVDSEVATAAIHDGALALDRLAHTPLHAGQRVLVTGAAGGLGHWFVPLAKAAGAYVVAAAGGARKVAAARDLGADLVLDYCDPDWTAGLDALVDVLYDCAGGAIGPVAAQHVVPGGTVFNHGSAGGEFANAEGRSLAFVGVERQLADPRALTGQALDLIADGVVHPSVGARVPLERAAEAHAAIEARSVIGKTVLTVGQA